MQQADGANSAKGALASSTNIIQFPLAGIRRRVDRHDRLNRQPRGDWPYRSGRRTPDLLIALAICKAMTADERGRVLSLVTLDHSIIGDDVGREAARLLGAMA